MKKEHTFIVQKFLDVSIGLKISGAFLLIILLVGLTFSVDIFYTTSLLNQYQERRETDLIQRQIEGRMEAALYAAEMALRVINNNHDAMKLFFEKDRPGLLKAYADVYSDLKKMGIDQFQFHLPDSVSFLRLHQPDRFGDSLASFRETVNQANRTKKMIRGLEEGRAGFGFRVVMPLFWNGNHIGSVELGSNFSNEFLSDLKNEYGGDYLIYRFPDSATVAWKTEGKHPYMLAATVKEDPAPGDEQFFKELKNGKAVYRAHKSGQSVFLIPFRDFSGNYRGYIKVITDKSEFYSVINQTHAVSIAIVLAGLGLAAFVSYMFVRLISDPLQKSIAFASEIAEGNLNAAIDVHCQDETGKLVCSLNDMKDHLKMLITEIIRNTENSRSASEELSRSASEISRAADQVSVTMEQIAAGASNLNDASAATYNAALKLDESQQKVTDIVNIVKEEVNVIGTSAFSAGEAASNAAGIIQIIQDIMKQSSSSVETLSRRLAVINDMTGTINSITEQINLLSLNASIEAARAGEAGRGFAVVAESVSRLADQSAAATNEINQAIADITQSASVTLRTIENGVREVDSGTGEIRNALLKMKQISDMIQSLVGRVDSITNAVRVQHEFTLRVKQSASLVSETAEQSAAGVEEVAATIEEISGMMSGLAVAASRLEEGSKNLQSLVRKFKVD